MSDIAKRQIEVNYQENGDIAIRMAEGRVFVIRRELRNLGQAHDRLKNGGTDKLDSRAIAAGKREKKTELRGAMSDVEFVRRELATHESGIAASQPNGTRPGEGVYADAAAGVGAPKGYVQRALPDENFTRTGTNHTANNLKSLEIDPKSIKLSDTLSGFSPSLDAEAIGGTFRSLRKGMGNVESPELLRKQAETAIRQELQTKYDAMMKEYDKLTPEAQRAMEAWRESMERQAKELAEDFQNALGTKLERGKMDGKWGNPEYMDRIMGTFAEKAPESLKSALLQKIPGVRRKENLVSE